ncbi:dTDP-glucose 4,6-dehydratase [Streptomyces sp. 4N509B]|uniref:dTDP-glucose 4,6-dehydratase n=1 Tax=Streptomyces sp. 4N509B TaxID=3457413 RepID=UPI003FD2A8C0
MRILVTGGAGFIGSHYVRTLLAGGYPGTSDAQVTVLDKLTYAGSRDNLPDEHPRMTFVEGDICDLPLLLEIFPGHDAVVHFAAESHVDRSLDAAGDFVETNVAGTQAVLEAALRSRVERVVYVSTDEVYGSIESGSWTEEWPLAPNSPYAASKAAAEMIARSYWRTYDVNLSVTRCSNNYGPYQHPEKLIPRFVTNLLDGEPVPLYGNGLNRREWLHVDDHCRGIHLVLEKGRAGEVYNIGGGNEYTNLALTELLLELCGMDHSMIRFVPDRKAHDLRYSMIDDKIREELGYAPRIPFSRGLAETVAWYQDHPEWWKAILNRRDAT